MTDEQISGSQTKPTTNKVKFIILAALLTGALVLSGCSIMKQRRQAATPQPNATQPGEAQLDGNTIPVQNLEDQYGIRVNLIAVTASGGLVDLRLKILNEEKARLLLQESSDLPILIVGEEGRMLMAAEDKPNLLLQSMEDDGNIFLIFPNSGNIVKPGMPVTVQFGDIRLEPIQAK